MKGNSIINKLSKCWWLVAIVFLIALFVGPKLLLHPVSNFFSLGNSTCVDTASQINNLTTPIIGFFSVIFLYLAFKTQYDFNKKIQYNEELSQYIAKLQFIKENYNPDFLTHFRTDTYKIFSVENSNNRTNILVDDINQYISKFKYTATDMKRSIKLLIMLNSQLQKSNLSKIDKEFLSIDINKLMHIKQNIQLYKFNKDYSSKLEINPKKFYAKYNDIINYIDKISID